MQSILLFFILHIFYMFFLSCFFLFFNFFLKISLVCVLLLLLLLSATVVAVSTYFPLQGFMHGIGRACMGSRLSFLYLLRHHLKKNLSKPPMFLMYSMSLLVDFEYAALTYMLFVVNEILLLSIFVITKMLLY